MPKNVAKLPRAFRVAWPFAVAFLLLPGWLAARTYLAPLDPALDLGLPVAMGVFVLLGMVLVLVNAGPWTGAVPTTDGAPAEVAVTDEGDGRFLLFATGVAGRASLAETANRLEALGEHSGLPRLVRVAEGRRHAQLTLDVGDARPLTVAASPDIFAARAIMSSLLEVVGRLHAHGYVLGDLPPGTICVRPDGSALLLLLAPPVGVAPSPRVSPEVSRGMPPEVRDDLFSLVAVLVELLTGLPFPLTAGDELDRILDARCPRALKLLVTRGLGTREERAGSVAALRQALDEIPWRAGFAAALHEKVRVLRSDPSLDDLELRRSWLFFERVTSRELGDFSVTLRSLNLLEIAFLSHGALALEGSFLETGSGRVLGTVTRGRVLVALASIDLRELAQLGVFLRTPSGDLHDLAPAVESEPLEPDDLGSALVARIGTRDREGWLALIRGRTPLMLRVLATDTLFLVLRADGDAGGPPPDIRLRIEDEVARRLLLRSERLRPESTAWKWLETILPRGDVAPAALASFSEAAVSDLTLEDRARSHARLLEKLAEAPGRLRGVARKAVSGLSTRGPERRAHAVAVISAIPPVPGLLSGTRTSVNIFPESIVESAHAAFLLDDGKPLPEDLAREAERSSSLAGALLGLEGCPRVEIGELPWSPRLATLPILVAIVLARAQRNPLPPQVAIAGALGPDGRIEAIGDSLEGVVEAAMASGVRLLFVPHAEVEAARRFRADRAADARDLVIDDLPDLPLRELVQLVEQRLGEHFPSQLELDPRRSRLLLAQAEEYIVTARPELALDSLAFLQRVLAHKRSRRSVNLRAVCLADTGRCRNARGQWRLALEAFTQARMELEGLSAQRSLDWSGAELLFDLPGQMATCLMHAFAFDAAERVLRDDLRAKNDCALVSAHSVAKSAATLGRLFLEWGVASGEGSSREEHFRQARDSLTTALESIDDEERPGALDSLGLLSAYQGDFEHAESVFAEVEDRALAAMGRVVMETRKGFAGEPEAFARAARDGERALAAHAFPAPLRARLARLVGTSLLECGDLPAARAKLLESRELFGTVRDAGSFLRAILPEIELARLECTAGRRVEAGRRIGDALARLEAVAKQIVGVSPFAKAYVADLTSGLVSARSSLALAGRAFALRDLREVLGRIFY
jgi:tetratricopeptide (TPR) repeat protein